MAKAFLEYSLPDEQEEYQCAVAGGKAHSALHEISQEIFRKRVKYGTYSEEVMREIEAMRDEFFTIVNSYNLDI